MKIVQTVMFLIILLMISGNVMSQVNCDYVETGLSYPIILHIQDITLCDGVVEIGDVICVLDEGLPVGSFEFISLEDKIVVIAWKKDDVYSLPGYTAGDLIEYQYYDASTDQTFEMAPVYERGDGSFESGGFSAISNFQCIDPCDTDNTPPLITCPSEITIQCNESTEPANTGTATATDNCDQNVTISYTDSNAEGSCLSIVRTWLATDNADNSASCDQLITVVDETAPVISCPADITVEENGSIDPIATGRPTASDNCDASLNITYLDVADGNIITRTWTATDDCDNNSSCDQLITIDNSFALSSDNLTFNTSEGATEPPPSQKIYINYTGGNGSFTWNVEPFFDEPYADWFMLDKLFGTGNDILEVSIVDPGFAPGIYSGYLRFNYINSSGSNIYKYVNISIFVETGTDVGSQTVYAGEGGRFGLPISIYSTVPLSGYTIPLKYNTNQPEEVVLDSVILSDESKGTLAVVIYDIPNQGFIIHRPIGEPPLPDSTDIEIGMAFFSISPNAVGETITIDTSTITIPGEGGATYSYQFIDTSEVPIESPEFNPGEIVIVPQTDIYEQEYEGGYIIPDGYNLYHNYPNPFNPTTIISFSLPRACDNVKLEIYNIIGQKIETLVSESLPAGNWSVTWDGEGFASGIYFYRISAGPFTNTRKMVLLK